MLAVRTDVAAAAEAARLLSQKLQPEEGVRSSFFLQRQEMAFYLKQQEGVILENEGTLRRAWSIFVSRRTSFAENLRNRLRETLSFQRLRADSLKDAYDSDREGEAGLVSDTIQGLSRSLGYLRWPNPLEQAGNACSGTARSKKARSSDKLVRWTSPSKRSRDHGQGGEKKRKRELWDTKTVITCHVQPMLICLTNSFLMRLHSGLHPAVLDEAEEDMVSTPERFCVKDRFDGSVILALHAAANAAFEPESILDPEAETANRRVCVHYRNMIRVGLLMHPCMSNFP